MADGWLGWNGMGRPDGVAATDRVMVRRAGDNAATGPYRADTVDWMKVMNYRRVVESPEAEILRAELEAERIIAAQRATIVTELTAQLDELRASRARVVDSLDSTMAERDQLKADLAATRGGMDGALNLQRAFLATAEVREARALREHASVKLEHARLLEQIATAISRGHLASDFYTQLREFCK